MGQPVSVRPYILAGGRSSRMGTDKGMLLLGGRTLLGRAVDTLRKVPVLQGDGGRVTVTIVGKRKELEGADRMITDRYPGCGPLGGMESALYDLEDNGGAEWAFFLPVDMPFLPMGLIAALLSNWLEAGCRGAKACYLVVDGRPQPLVSMVHRSLRVSLAGALTAGRLKVTPVLKSITESLASTYTEGLGYGQLVLCMTPASLDGSVPVLPGWTPTGEQEQFMPLWFSNLNNEEDFNKAETFASSLG